MAERRAGLKSGLGSDLAAIVTAFKNLPKAALRFWSAASFLCLILLNLEWPDTLKF